jgi:very-short-patch-repair endonuclease
MILRQVNKERRRSLRNNLTPAEAFLWQYLKNKQLDGRKFRRQHSVGKYILDFYCPSEKLGIELDGAHHGTDAGREYDERRTQFISTQGIRIVRFENREVFEATDFVLNYIKKQFSSL